MGPGVLPGWPALSSCPWSLLSPQEALLVALKSLPSGTLLNLASFGADIKTLFPSSRLCSNVSATGKSWRSTNPSLSLSQLLDVGWGLVSQGWLQGRLFVLTGDVAPCLRAPGRAAGRPWCHQPAGSPGLGTGTAPPPRLPSPAVPLHRCSSGQCQQDPPAGAQAGQHCQVRHWHCGGTPCSLIPHAVPSDFSLCSPKSYLSLPQGCPSPIASLSPSPRLLLGCPSPAQSQGSTLALRSRCPSLLKISSLGLPAPSPAQPWLSIPGSPAGASALAWARGCAGGC